MNASSASSDGERCRRSRRDPCRWSSRHRPRGAAVPAAGPRAGDDVGHRGRDLRHRLHGAEHPRRPHRAGRRSATAPGSASPRMPRASSQRSLVAGLVRAAAVARPRDGRWCIAAVFGALILRRRGVYFSLLTLALSAMLYVVAFRWTDFTGGEDGLGGIARPRSVRLSFESASAYYVLVAVVALRSSRVPALALPSLAGRQRAGRDPRERAARALPRLRHRSLQAARLRRLGHAHGARGHPAAVQQPDDLGRARSRSRSPASCWRWSSSAACARSSDLRSARCSSCSSATTCRASPRTGCSTSGCCSSRSSSSRRPGWSGSTSD